MIEKKSRKKSGNNIAKIYKKTVPKFETVDFLLLKVLFAIPQMQESDRNNLR